MAVRCAIAGDFAVNPAQAPKQSKRRLIGTTSRLS
jgi:hypothetical protein